MIRTMRMILLVGAGILTIAGTFLPWVSWNNIWKDQDPAKPTVGGQWTFKSGHEHDPVYIWNGMGATGGFDVTVVTYDQGFETSRLSASSSKLPKESMIFLIPAGLAALAATFLRRKWLVSLLCIPAVGATTSVMSAALPFLHVAKALETQRGFATLDPTLGYGAICLLVGATLSLVGGVLIWVEPGTGGKAATTQPLP